MQMNPLGVFKAFSVMQSVLLQKPHAKSKSKEHTVYLERRLVDYIYGLKADFKN